MSQQNDPQPQGDGPNPWVKQLMIWGGIFLALLLVVTMFSNAGSSPGTAIRYSDFRAAVAEGVYYGIRVGGRLVSAAGTHVISKEARLGVVGNVLTNVSLGKVAVSFTHTVKVRHRLAHVQAGADG